jgi:hypothetical protein
VKNSYGKRNFMQPMGRPHHALMVACLFSFLVLGGGEGGGGGKVFFSILPWFPMCSHYVPLKFPMGSHQIFNVFQVPNVFPKMFSIAPHLNPICFGKCCPPFTYIGRPKGRNSTFYVG